MIFTLPTDTCYGLAGGFTREDYEHIYALKGRDFSKQLAFLVEKYEDMSQYVEITQDQIEFLKQYPHPWSFLGKRNSHYLLPDFLDSEKYSMISLRVAQNCLNEDIRMKIRYPIFLTSANLSGGKESKTFQEVMNLFPGIGGFDGGLCDRMPSDIFSLTETGELHYTRRNY